MKIDEQVERLNNISEILDNNKIGIEESLKLFEEANDITKSCFDYLDSLKGKITIIKKDLEKYKEENFN